MANKTHNDATAENIGQAPQGVELGGNLSPRRLNPEAGLKAIRTGQGQLCGWIYGEAYSYKPGVSQFGEYVRLIGSFTGLPADRSSPVSASEIFLPAVPTRALCAAIDQGGKPSLRFEFWAYPDTSGRPGSEAKYIYRTFAETPPDALPVGTRMMIAAGLIEAPKLALPAADPDAWPEGVDPATGEVVPVAQEEENRVKDGLDKLLEPRAAAE